MEWVIALVLAVFLGYLIYEELFPNGKPAMLQSKRLCDYYVAGSVFEDIPDALRRGVRLLEVHIYSDEQDHPVVAKKQLNDGYDFAEDNVPFERVCVDIVNDAFPSKDPFILSMVFHTDKTIVFDRVTEHLQTTVRRHLCPWKNVHSAPLDVLANKLILVSGGNVAGTSLEPLLNMSWNDMSLRRLTHLQAASPRDPEELTNFNRDFISLVAPDVGLKVVNQNPLQPTAYGCQWNLYAKGRTGFIEKPASLQ